MQNQVVRDNFLFVGDDVALDFLNTKPVLKAQARELLTDFSALLRWFVAAGLVARSEAERLGARWSGSAEAKDALARVLAFRENLRASDSAG